MTEMERRHHAEYEKETLGTPAHVAAMAEDYAERMYAAIEDRMQKMATEAWVARITAEAKATGQIAYVTVTQHGTMLSTEPDRHAQKEGN